MSKGTFLRTNGAQVTIFTGGKSFSVDERHPNWKKINKALDERRFEDIERLVNIATTITEGMKGRVDIKGDTLYYNDEPLYGKLTDTIIKFHNENRPFDRLVKFLDKVMENPSRNSREQLYSFLDRNNFTITEDGDFIAFKGLNDELRSIHAGPGIVNGEEYDGHLDNAPGNVVQIDRKTVIDDPNQACSFGLHVGDYSYASLFGSRLVEVLVNPAHVVSVPNDSFYRKVRVCEYRVLREIENQYSTGKRGRDDSEVYQGEDEFITWLERFVAPYDGGSTGTTFTDLAERYLENAGTVSDDYAEGVKSLAARFDTYGQKVSRSSLDYALSRYRGEQDNDWSVEVVSEDEWDGQAPGFGHTPEFEEEDDEEEDVASDVDADIKAFLDWLDARREDYTRKGRMANSYLEIAESFLEDTTYINDEDNVIEFAEGLDLSHTAQKVYRYHVDAMLADRGYPL